MNNKIFLFLLSILIYDVNGACVSTTTAHPAANKVCHSGYVLHNDGLCHPYSFACESNLNPNFYNFENGTCTCDYLYNCNAPGMVFDPDTCGCTCQNNKFWDASTSN